MAGDVGRSLHPDSIIATIILPAHLLGVILINQLNNEKN